MKTQLGSFKNIRTTTSISSLSINLDTPVLTRNLCSLVLENLQATKAIGTLLDTVTSLML